MHHLNLPSKESRSFLPTKELITLTTNTLKQEYPSKGRTLLKLTHKGKKCLLEEGENTNVHA